jgi:hypothetical protein
METININAAKELTELDSALNEKIAEIKKKKKEAFKAEIERLWKEFDAFFKEHGLSPQNYVDGEKTIFSVTMGRLHITFDITHYNGNILNACFTTKSNDGKKQQFLHIRFSDKLQDLSHSDKDIAVEQLIPKVKDLIRKADENLKILERPDFKLESLKENIYTDEKSLTAYLKTKFQ